MRRPADSRPRRRPEIVVAGIVVLAATAYFLYAAAWSHWWQWRAQTHFQPVPAQVVSAKVLSRAAGARTQGESFFPDIVYRYRVDGRDFQSDRYFFTGDGWADAAAAAATVGRFPVGATVTAYVDASRPERAVLDRSGPRPGMLVVLLFFAAAGLGLLVHGLRHRPSV